MLTKEQFFKKDV